MMAATVNKIVYILCITYIYDRLQIDLYGELYTDSYIHINYMNNKTN